MSDNQFEQYHEVCNKQVVWEEERYKFGLQKIREIINQTTLPKVLDVGTNIGNGINAIKNEEDICLFSIDLDYNLLKESVSKTEVDSINADAKKLPFKDEAFEAVSLYEMIEHLDESEQKEVIKEINRVVKKSGIILISTPNAKENGSRPMSNDHKHELEKDELKNLLTTNGFEIVGEYGQGFLDNENIIHKIFRDLRGNNIVGKMYDNLVPWLIKKRVRDLTLSLQGKSSVSEKANTESRERVMFFVAKKVS